MGYWLSTLNSSVYSLDDGDLSSRLQIVFVRKGLGGDPIPAHHDHRRTAVEVRPVGGRHDRANFNRGRPLRAAQRGSLPGETPVAVARTLGFASGRPQTTETCLVRRPWSRQNLG